MNVTSGVLCSSSVHYTYTYRYTVSRSIRRITHKWLHVYGYVYVYACMYARVTSINAFRQCKKFFYQRPTSIRYTNKLHCTEARLLRPLQLAVTRHTGSGYLFKYKYRLYNINCRVPCIFLRGSALELSMDVVGGNEKTTEFGPRI